MNAGLSINVLGIQIRMKLAGVFELTNSICCLKGSLHDMIMLGSEVGTVATHIISLER